MLMVSAQTNVGKMRSVNQDTIYVSTDPLGPLPNLFVVADGMGGHNGGEIASKEAIAHFSGYIAGLGEKTEEGVLDLLTSAASAANKEVLEQAIRNPELAGMGTTLTACTIDQKNDQNNGQNNGQKKCNIIHIGDSRAYAITSDKITQLTYDHSYVNEMVKAGQITQDEARGHPKRNVLTRVLGINPEMSADGYVFDIEPGSVILLCSDGLYNMVPEDEIKYIINNTEKEPALALIAAANERGGTDNISAVVIDTVNRIEEVIP